MKQTYSIIQDSINPTKAVPTSDNVEYWLSRGYKVVATIEAMSEKAAIHIFEGKQQVKQNQKAPTMQHGYDETDSTLQPTGKTMVGVVFLVIGAFAALIAAMALTDLSNVSSYASSYRIQGYYQKLTISGAISTLSFITGSILVIIGSIQNKVIESHNLLIEKVGK